MPTGTMNLEILGFLTLAAGTIFGQFLIALQTTPQPTYRDIWSVLDRYGLPMAILAAMFLFGYRVLWPFVTSLIASSQELMRTELGYSREQMKHQGEQFLAALTRRDEIMKAEFASLHQRLDNGFKALLEHRGKS